jgi:hypothetical protein
VFLNLCPAPETHGKDRVPVVIVGTMLAKCSNIKNIRLPGDSIDDYDLKDCSKVCSYAI